MSDVIRLLIVDDHPVVRDGLRGMCDASEEFDVIGEASDGKDAIRHVEQLDPDVVLMDLRMAGGGGLEAIVELTARSARANVLVLTTYDTDHDIMAALDAGATGYLLKDAPRDDLFAAIRAAAKGKSMLSPSVATRVVSRVRSRTDALSGREQEIVAHVAKGRSNREIAAALFVSEATVKTHLAHAFEKLGVKDRAAAVAIAYERGLLGN